MKAFMVLSILITMSIMAYVAVGLVQINDPNYSYQEEGRSLFVGNPYSEIRKGALKAKGVTLYKTEKNKETFVQYECFSSFYLNNGIITDFKMSGNCNR